MFDQEEEYDFSDEEVEEMRQRLEDEQYSSPVSMDSLGLTWRDFF